MTDQRDGRVFVEWHLLAETTASIWQADAFLRRRPSWSRPPLLERTRRVATFACPPE
jgi:hypothetical protein